ncbi:MAG: tannase/feruloyl esterase family alpha/beta hydrolase [Hyphomonadaceae bacterium]|nr:tannase/feruloyl esterase family alpha/beta hydrolase [Hyphomonadaceae bacterium]
MRLARAWALTQRSLVATALGFFGLAGTPALADDPIEPWTISDPARRCEALDLINLETVGDQPARIVQTNYYEAKPASARDTLFFHKRGISQGNPTPTGMEVFPEHCLVEGYITPHVQFALMLPPPGAWNENFMLAACDAWCGKVHLDSAVPGLYDGYATITNNGGHYSRAPFDGIWAYNDIPARENFAYLANHTSAQIGKAIARAYYGSDVEYSYITGFSKGGNAGLMAAQRYPEDFDGIISKAPVVPYNEKNAAHLSWMARAIYPENDFTPIMYSDKAPLIDEAVLAACDELDGVKDSIIDDPSACEFDPGVLLCKEGEMEIRAECLTAEQVEAVRKIYSRPYNEDGEFYYPSGVEFGTESDWARTILPVRGADELPFTLTAATSGLRYMVFDESPGPGFDWRDFDFERDEHLLTGTSDMMNPDDVDLTEFKARGGKIIIVHGWADVLISPVDTINYFEAVSEFMGGPDAMAEFAQLYLVPGMHHGSGGHGPHLFDAQTALEKWVEEGVAPTELLMTDEEDARVYRERIFYPYPARSVYRGEGDPNLASSYMRVEE